MNADATEAIMVTLLKTATAYILHAQHYILLITMHHLIETQHYLVYAFLLNSKRYIYIYALLYIMCVT